MYRRRERLNKMTHGMALEDIYGATIGRIKAQGGDKLRLGMGALMWICHAEEPLSAKVLCHALAIELGSTDFNAANIPSIATLLGCCQGLIIVDKEESKMRLIHFTLREYLSAHPDIFNRPHSEIAEICLTYLNCQQVKALSVDTEADLHALIDNEPFLAYCSRYWGVHAKKELSDYAMSLALQLFREYDGHISVALLAGIEWAVYPEDHPTGSLWNGLHCASYFGIAEVVTALIQMGCYDLNEGDYWWFTTLALAAWMGHDEVVEILLGREEVSPDKPDNDGWTPLSLAARKGNEGVVKILLGREEVNPDNPDNRGRTPLSLAAAEGKEEVVQILLRREEVNPDMPDNSGRTPLSWAAESGREEVVKILLGRGGVNPDMPDNGGRTPLSWAAESGKEEVVKILLGWEEANPDMPDNSGRTPLSWAAESGREEVVRILLGREEVNPDKPDSKGQTPLTRANNFWWRSRGVVALLESHKAVTHSAT